jgi:hypothetical protein
MPTLRAVNGVKRLECALPLLSEQSARRKPKPLDTAEQRLCLVVVNGIAGLWRLSR